MRALVVSIPFLLAACDDPHTNGPYIQWVTPDSANISWETPTPEETELEWGLSEAYGRRAVVPGKSRLHEVTITGLQPGALHHYRVLAGESDTTGYSFRTAPLEAKPIHFAVYGDSQDNPSKHEEIADAIASERPEFVLHVGDAVQEGLDQESWHDELFVPAKRLMANVPVYAAMGDHEQDSKWFYYYRSYGSPGNYYSFSWGPVFVVVIDTNQRFDPGTPQYDWIVATLSSKAAQDAAWLIATHHQPGYTEIDCNDDGLAGVRSVLMPLMARYGVDVVFNGHSHGYERGEQEGVQFVVTGGGGGDLQERCRELPQVSVSKSVHHYLSVDIDGASLTLRARTAGGFVFDTFRIQK